MLILHLFPPSPFQSVHSSLLILSFSTFHGYFLHPPPPSYASNLFFSHSYSSHLCGVILTAMCKEEPRESWGALGVWGRTATLNTWLSKLVWGLAELDTWEGKATWINKGFLDQFQTFPWQWLPVIPTASKMGYTCVSQTHNYILHSSTKKIKSRVSNS